MNTLYDLIGQRIDTQVDCIYFYPYWRSCLCDKLNRIFIPADRVTPVIKSYMIHSVLTNNNRCT